MSIDEAEPVTLQQGTIARLNFDAGFGYVRDSTGQNTYIFVFGKAIRHAQASGLSVGQAVTFRVSGHGRVDELIS